MNEILRPRRGGPKPSSKAAPKAAVADLASGRMGARLAEIAEAASAIILPYWRANAVVTTKSDDSPVTEADREAEAFILARLGDLYPDCVLVAEEDTAARGALPCGDHFFLVDPLDGTRGFIAGREGFAVNIGYVSGGRPVAGAIAAPALGVVWYTGSDGALRRRFGETQGTPIKVRHRPDGGGVAVLSHSLKDEEAQRLAGRHGATRWQGMDSAVKFCLVAEGRFDVYPRPGRTMEWDTAAGEAILSAAGGRVVGEDGRPLAYGKLDAGYANPGFVAMGS